MKCRVCGKETRKRIPQLYESIDSGAFTGCCNDCAPKRRKNPLSSKGRIALPRGYIKRHIRSFTEEEQRILFPSRDGHDYILEHRAVMSIHLGRPLADYEVVHHLNGNKGDNQLKNLVLSTTDEHNGTHIEILERLNQLIKRVKELEDENQLLRSQAIR